MEGNSFLQNPSGSARCCAAFSVGGEGRSANSSLPWRGCPGKTRVTGSLGALQGDRLLSPWRVSAPPWPGAPRVLATSRSPDDITSRERAVSDCVVTEDRSRAGPAARRESACPPRTAPLRPDKPQGVGNTRRRTCMNSPDPAIRPARPSPAASVLRPPQPPAGRNHPTADWIVKRRLSCDELTFVAPRVRRGVLWRGRRERWPQQPGIAADTRPGKEPNSKRDVWFLGWARPSRPAKSGIAGPGSRPTGTGENASGTSVAPSRPPAAVWSLLAKRPRGLSSSPQAAPRRHLSEVSSPATRRGVSSGPRARIKRGTNEERRPRVPTDGQRRQEPLTVALVTAVAVCT